MNTATITRTPPLQAIATNAQRAPWARRGSVVDWTAYAVTGPGRVTPAGEVWRNRAGDWFALRTGYDAPTVGYVTRADALASVGWLDTLTADTIAGQLHAFGASLPVVLSDGTVAHVYSAERVTVPMFAGIGRQPVDRPAVELTATVDGSAVTLARRWPVSFDALRIRPWALMVGTGSGRVRIPAYRITFRAHAPVAVLPPVRLVAS